MLNSSKVVKFLLKRLPSASAMMLVLFAPSTAFSANNVDVDVTPSPASRRDTITATWTADVVDPTTVQLRLFNNKTGTTVFWQSPLESITQSTTHTYSFKAACNWPSTDSQAGAAYKMAVFINGVAEENDSWVMHEVNANESPDAHEGIFTIADNELLNGTLLATDPENDTLTFSLSIPSPDGTTIIDKDSGTFKFSPNPGFIGTTSFVFGAQDCGVATFATVTIDVYQSNRAPVATNNSFLLSEDATLNGFLPSSDLDGDLLIYSLVTPLGTGTLSLDASGHFQYDPPPDFYGIVDFTYQVFDGQVYSQTATVTIEILPVNDAPTVTGNVIEGNEDSLISGFFSASDVDSPDIGFRISQEPMGGTVLIAGNQFTYIPSNNFHGYDTFRFVANDGTAESAPAAVEITVYSVNDLPLASSSIIELEEDASISGLLSATDVDGDVLGFQISEMPSHGFVQIIGDQFIYTPAFNYHGDDTFQFVAHDGFADSIPASVNINVRSVNDAPIATSNSYSIQQGATLSGQLSGDDIDGDLLTYAVIQPSSSGALVVNPDGIFTFQPNSGFSGVTTFQFFTDDGFAVSVPATVTISVTGPVGNSPPIVSQTAYFAFQGEQTTLLLLATDADFDPITFRIASPPTGGTLTYSPPVLPPPFLYPYPNPFPQPGPPQYAFFTPTPGFYGTTTFILGVSDGKTESLVTIYITVIKNEKPIVSDVNITATSASGIGQIQASDPEGENLVYSIRIPSPYVDIQLNPTTGSFTYSLKSGSSIGPIIAYFSVSDGMRSADGKITITHEYVMLASDGQYDVDEDGQLGGTLTGVNLEGGGVYFVITESHNGWATTSRFYGADPAHNFWFSPTPGFVGVAYFKYQAYNGYYAYSVTRTITINVRPVNDAPTASPKVYFARKNEPFLGQVSGFDLEMSPLTYEVSLSIHGEATFTQATGEFTFVPEPEWTGTAYFTYRAFDGELYSSPSFVTLHYRGLPEAYPSAISGFEDTQVNGRLLARDPQGNALTYSLTTYPSAGTISLDASTGSYSFQPPIDWSGTLGFTFKARSIEGDSNTAQATISIAPVLDAACVLDQSFTLIDGLSVDGRLTASNPDQRQAEFSVASSTIDGNYSLDADGRYSFSPAPGFHGETDVVVNVWDPLLQSSTARITFDVEQTVPDIDPFALDAFHTSPINTIIRSKLAVSSLRLGPVFNIREHTEHGAIAVDAVTGEYTFSPDFLWYGRTSFTYDVTYPDGATTNTGVVRIKMVPPTPVAHPASFTSNYYEAISGTLSAIDPLGIPLRYSLACGVQTDGELSLDQASGTFHFQPNEGFFGQTGFVFRVDNGYAWSATQYVSLNVKPRAPEAFPFSLTGQTGSIAAGNLDGYDPLGLPLTYHLVSSSEANGTFTLNPLTGTFLFVPVHPGWRGTTVAEFYVSNGSLSSEPQTVTITFGNYSFASAPLALDLINVMTPYQQTPSWNMRASGTLLGFDPQGAGISFRLVSIQPELEPFTVSQSNGAYEVRLQEDFFGITSFSYVVNNGTMDSNVATVTIISPKPSGEPIHMGSDLSLTTFEDTQATGQFRMVDPEGSEVIYYFTGCHLCTETDRYFGSVVMDPKTGIYTVMPTQDWNGVSTFNIYAFDSGIYGKLVSVTVTVLPINDQPIIKDVMVSGQENEEISSVLDGFDVENDILTFDALDQPAFGALSVDPDGLFVFVPPSGWYGTASFRYRAFDGELYSETKTVTLHVLPGANNLTPVDPSTVATPLPCCTAPNFSDSVKFLFSGSNLVQFGVLEGIIDPLHVAVARGRVLGVQGIPLPGAKISIAGHPEFGFTFSRADGYFDLALNGGGIFILEIDKGGYIVVHRQIEAPWLDYVTIEDVPLTPLDPSATEIQLGSSLPQIHRSSTSADERGSRQTNVLFLSGTQASIRRKDGTIAPLSGAVHLRATEVSVGEDGQQRLPAALPLSVAYVYGAEFSLDESLTPDVLRVEFSQPVILYVDNYLDFPVGSLIPVGYYERNQKDSGWRPEKNGRVIQIVSVNSGVAAIDVNGDGLEDANERLQLLGIGGEELTQIASLYSAGDSFWRVSTRHFSYFNFGGFLEYLSHAATGTLLHKLDPPRLSPPSGRAPNVSVQDQSIKHRIPIPGTEYSLVSDSQNSSGALHRTHRSIKMLSDYMPPGIAIVILQTRIAGKFEEKQFLPRPNLSTTVSWDGKDAYGRTINGTEIMDVRLGYRYHFPILLNKANLEEQFNQIRSDFAKYPNLDTYYTTLSSDFQMIDFTVWASQSAVLENWVTPIEDLGGFNLDAKKDYEPRTRILRSSEVGDLHTSQLGKTITVVAGNGSWEYSGEGLPAMENGMSPTDVVVLPDGRIVFSDKGNGRQSGRIRRINLDGRIETIAGADSSLAWPESLSGEMNALNIELNRPGLLTLAKNGDLYFTVAKQICSQCGWYMKILKLTAQGKVITVKNDLGDVGGLAIDHEGRVLYSATKSNLIYRLGRDGSNEIIAGTGIPRFNSPGNRPAVSVDIIGPTSIAVAQDGTVFFAESGGSYIRKISGDGILHNVAGAGVNCYSINEDIAVDEFGSAYDDIEFDFLSCRQLGVSTTGKAISASVGFPGMIRTTKNGIMVSALPGISNNPFCPNFSCYWSTTSAAAQMVNDMILPFDQSWEQANILKIDSDGNLHGSVGGVAGGVPSRSPGAVVFSIAPDETIYFVRNFRIWRFGEAFPGATTFPIEISANGRRELFDSNGRQLAVRDRQTNVLATSYRYESNGRLAGIVDRHGRETLIQRDSQGLSSIVSPDGLRVDFVLDQNKRIVEARTDTGIVQQFNYDSRGRISEYVNPLGSSQNNEFDPEGRLSLTRSTGGFNLSYGRSGTTASLVTLLAAGGRPYGVTAMDAAGRVRQLGVSEHWQISAEGGELSGDYSRRANTNSAGLATDVFESKLDRWAFLPSGARAISQLALDPQDSSPYVTHQRIDLSPEVIVEINTKRTIDTDTNLQTSTYEIGYSTDKRISTETYNPETGERIAASAMDRKNYVLLDGAGQPVMQRSGTLAPVYTTYDPAGRVAKIVQGYDQNFRETSFVYDSRGRLTEKIDSLGRHEIYRYDQRDKLVETQLADDRTIAYTFDILGKMTSITPPGKAAHTFGYSITNLMENYLPPGGQTTQFVYSPITRELMSVIRPGGDVVSYIRDDAGRQSSIETATGNIGFNYNPETGKLVSVTSAEVATSFNFSGELPGAVQTVTNHFSASVKLDYNHKLDTVKETVELGASTNVANFIHDADGLLIGTDIMHVKRDLENGLVTEVHSGALSGYVAYNIFGEMMGTSTVVSSSSALYTASYTRDGAGRVITKTENTLGATWTYLYSYDIAGRLVQVDRNGQPYSTHSYDSNGNRLVYTSLATVREGFYDGDDRLLSYGDFEYSYAMGGELLTKRNTNTLETWTYTYNSLGGLSDVNLPDGKIIHYVIDGMQRRVGKTVDGTFVEGYVYGNGSQIVADVFADGTLRNRFVYASGGRLPDYFDREGKTYRMLTDHLGSVRLVVDIAAGGIAQRIEYDEFGNVLEDTNPGFQPFGFAGGLYDPNTGLVRFGARDYDPYTGRWTAKDPILFDGGDTNLYGYVLNDPINGIDPSGLFESTRPTNISLYENCSPTTISASGSNVPRCFSGRNVAINGNDPNGYSAGGQVDGRSAVPGGDAIITGSLLATAGIAAYAAAPAAVAACVSSQFVCANAIDFVDGMFGRGGTPPMTPGGVVGGFIDAMTNTGDRILGGR